jgi:UDP-N-acetylmuramate dehydrogenase
MEIIKNASLKSLNTFGIQCHSTERIDLSNEEQIPSIVDYIKNSNKKLLILGGGSNVLFTKDFDGIILTNNLTGINKIKEDENSVLLKVAAGEEWHAFVLYCIDNKYAGVENLSLIPGKVGASPMQNIGAYGVEVKDVIDSVEAFHLKTGEKKIFQNEVCEFGYRTSIFKTTVKGEYLITAVNFKLNKNPNVNTSYGAINNELSERGITNPTIKDVSDAVIAIRSSKLPDPKVIGNAGSFFKNPVVSAELANTLKKQFENIPVYDVGNNEFKLAAGWLIEQCGWKGKTIGNYGVHKLQALVLVNYGGATGDEIYQLSTDILESVKSKFGVELEREVNII